VHEGELVQLQKVLGGLVPEPWRPSSAPAVGACFPCCSPAEGGGETGWAGAVVLEGGRIVAQAVVRRPVAAAYRPGVLALRLGALLDAAVRALPALPDVLLVDATGRDHPRRAGLAFHLGAVLALPTVGVTHRPLLAEGAWPPDERGALSPLAIADELVGYWVRTRAGTRPLAAHAAWRTSPETAAALVLAQATRARTPEPLRRAREAARTARTSARRAGGDAHW
jgi:deoxyribonuclease V